MLRVSYARTLETPFNENLVLSNNGCENAVLIAALVRRASRRNLNPGFRNEFHAGFQQAFGKYLVFSGEYIWKYTHNAYDFSVLGNTPITSPSSGTTRRFRAMRSVFTCRIIMASRPTCHVFSVAARFFPPQVGRAGVTGGQSGLPLPHRPR